VQLYYHTLVVGFVRVYSTLFQTFKKKCFVSNQKHRWGKLFKTFSLKKNTFHVRADSRLNKQTLIILQRVCKSGIGFDL
jgi:hypothetical protein